MSTAVRIPAFDGTTKNGQRLEDLNTSPDVKTDVDCDLGCPKSETLQASAPAEKPTAKITYDTVEDELRTTTSETEKQETSDDGRTITRCVKTIRYYQPVIHRTLADGVVVNETPEEVLVGSYEDEYCFDAPLDVVDMYSASVETQSSVDETEQTLADGTWLRRKVTRVVAYLAVDDEETETNRDAGAESKPAGREAPGDSKHADQPDRATKTDAELQKSTTDGRLEPKEFAPGAVERATEQVIAEKPVATVSELETEHLEHAQLESDSHSVPSTKQATDSCDLTCKVETPSVVAEAEPEYEKDQAVLITRDQSTADTTTAEGSISKPESSEVNSEVVEGDIVKLSEEKYSEDTLSDGTTVRKNVMTTKHMRPVTTIVRNVSGAEEQFTVDKLLGTEIHEHRVILEPGVLQLRDDQLENETQVETSEDKAEDGTWIKRAVTTVTVKCKKTAAEQRETEKPSEDQKVTEPPASGAVSAEVPVKESLDLNASPQPSANLLHQDTAKANLEQQPPRLRPGVDEAMAPSKSSTVTEPKDVSMQYTESPTERMPVIEELITAVPNARQDRARPTMTSVPITSSFDEPEEFPQSEQLIEEQQTVEQFSTPRCDLEPVSEETVTPNIRRSKVSAALDAVKLDSIAEKTMSMPGSVHDSKKTETTEERGAVLSATTARIDDSVTKETRDSAAGMSEVEVTEEVIVAAPNPRQERARPRMTSEPITSSFDEAEELIEECPAVEQFAAPVCDLKPVEEDVIAPSTRRPVESIKDSIKPEPDLVHGKSTPEMLRQDSATPTPDTETVEQVEVSGTEEVPVSEELITAAKSLRQDRSPRPDVATVPMTSSFDEPEELIEEQQTVKQFAAPPCDMKPVEEDHIAADSRPPRASSRDTATLDSLDRTPFVPVENIKATSEAVQLQSSPTDSKPVTVDQPRTRPVLVLKTDSDLKAGASASTYEPTMPPSSRQPRRPRSAQEITSRRYGIESPQPGVYAKTRMRRESPLSFVDRLAYATSPTPLGMEEFDIPLYDDGCRQVRTRSKKLITRKVRKVRHDGEVVEDIVTEEVPDYGYSDTSSMRSGQSPAVMSPRSPSASSMTSPLPIEPASPGADSLSSQSSLRVFTDTVEGEPEVVTDVQEREETLPDGRVVIRKIIRTRQKQTIVKRTVMEGPLADDEQPTDGSGQLVAAGEDLQKPDIRTYSDAMDMRPSTDTVSRDVEEVLPDGTVQRKLTTTTSTRQLKTARTVVEGPYVPETVTQALQGDILRHDETAMLPQLASSASASRPPSTVTKSSGSSRTSARPKFRISMESPPPAAGENVAAAPPIKMTDSSQPAGQPHSEEDDQSQRFTQPPHQ